MTDDGSPRSSPSESMRWLGAGILLASLAARALATTSELPGWDMDPTIVSAPLGGIGPAWSFWFDVAALVGAGLALLGEAGGGRSIRPWPMALTGIGWIAIVWHGWLDPNATLGDRRVGSSWGAAMVGAVALWHLCRDERFRRVAGAVAIGLIAVLALKGVQDVFLAHPRTVDQFDQQRETFFAAQGWSAESPMARSYERRLLQPEASGWFGLANVYASFAAASSVAMLVLVVAWLARWRRERAPGGLSTAGAIALGLILAIGALALSGAKGGFMAAGGGIMAVGVLVLVMRRVRTGPTPAWASPVAALVGFFAVVGPLLLIISAGLVGEGLSDRSLLYRWFYLQAAARISAENPLLGVGPDGFQAAYLIAKNPLSPEDVRSPHSVLLDWTATLGVVGLLSWGALWLYWVCDASRRPLRLAGLSADGIATPSPLRPELRAAGLIAAAATLLATYIDRTHATPDVAAVRFVGLVAWCIVAWGIIAAGRHALTMSLALAGATLALAAHGQIDVAPTLPASAGLFMAIIAAAAAPDTGHPLARAAGAPSPRRRITALAPGAALIACGAALAVTTAAPVTRWEGTLTAAAAAARPIAEASDLLREVQLAEDAQTRRTLQARLLTDLAAQLGRRIEGTSAGVESALVELEFVRLRAAATGLEAASAMQPSEWRTRREASRLYLRLASQEARIARLGGTGGERRHAEALRLMDHGVAIARGEEPPGLRIPPPGATEHAWLGLVYRTCSELASREGDLRNSIAAFEGAARLDPYNTEIAAQLFELHRRLGDGAASVRWGRRTLELDDLARLDPEARALPPKRRAAIEGALPPP